MFGGTAVRIVEEKVKKKGNSADGRKIPRRQKIERVPWEN